MRLGRSFIMLAGLLLDLSQSVSAAPAIVIQDLRYDPKESAIYLPFEGPRPPLVTVGTSGLNIVLDIPQSGFLYGEFFATVERSPLVKAFVAVVDPESKGLHVIIEGLVPLRAEADASYSGQSLRFALVPTDPKQAANLPVARNVRQTVTVVPADGRGAKTYTIEQPQPPVVILPPSWSKALGQWSYPAPSLGLSYGPTSEQYAPQVVTANDPGMARISCNWQPVSGRNSLPMRLERGASLVQDPDYRGVTHQRSETSLEAGYARSYELAGRAFSTGCGYWLNWMQTSNSANPVTPTLLFAGNQIFHGPALRQTMAGGLGDSPWGQLVGELALDWVPWVFSSIEQGISMPWLMSFRVEPRLTIGGEKPVSLGLFYERTVGAPFNREASGLSLSLSFGRF